MKRPLTCLANARCPAYELNLRRSINAVLGDIHCHFIAPSHNIIIGIIYMCIACLYLLFKKTLQGNCGLKHIKHAVEDNLSRQVLFYRLLAASLLFTISGSNSLTV